jgi:DME family drug/metabolite transporter
VTLSLAEPLTAGLLGLVVGGETLTPAAAFGLILLVSSLLALA